MSGHFSRLIWAKSIAPKRLSSASSENALKVGGGFLFGTLENREIVSMDTMGSQPLLPD